MKHAANFITLIRLLLTPLIVYQIMHEQYCAAGLLFLCAMMSDVCDGFVARRFGIQSLFGQYFDAFVDKILMASVVMSLLLVGKALIPIVAWYACVVLMIKEVLLLSGATCAWMLGSDMILPSQFSRMVSFFEFLFIMICFLFVATSFIPLMVIYFFALINIFLAMWLLLWYGYLLIRANI